MGTVTALMRLLWIAVFDYVTCFNVETEIPCLNVTVHLFRKFPYFADTVRHEPVYQKTLLIGEMCREQYSG